MSVGETAEAATKIKEDPVDYFVKNGYWFKTRKGYYRLTEKGWNEINPKVRLGQNYKEYLNLTKDEGRF